MTTRVLVGVGLVIALALAFFGGPRASSEPDGLSKVAIEQEFERAERSSASGDSPLADYSVRGVDDSNVATALAGVIGVALTFVFGLGVFALVRRRAQES